uniref:Uncharacterized protein n=1 Tax=Lutzomyia longipalpis TaxID=7200 RepID=A0A1B0CAV7_LUTLO
MHFYEMFFRYLIVIYYIPFIQFLIIQYLLQNLYNSYICLKKNKELNH